MLNAVPLQAGPGIALARRMKVSGSRVVQALAVLAGAAWLVRRLRRYSLRGKNVLVAGGGRGLGLDIARVLVDRGAPRLRTGFCPASWSAS